MNVKELIEMLEQFNPEAEVKFAYNYGDHWNTLVAADVNCAEEQIVEHSDYHNMDKVVEEPDEWDEDKVCVVLM